MKHKFRDKKFKSVVLALILSFLLEGYIIFIENSNFVFEFSNHDFITLFSFKEFFVFLIIFLVIFYFLIDKNRRIKTLNFIYVYRLPLAFIILIIAVIFQIHGSSINEMNHFHVIHKPLIGVSRPFRSDEFIVNTPYAFSQYMNNFAYFSEIVRGTLTDMFIIYGQPVLDIGTIFRPFLIGYLFLNQGQGLSFFWVGRFIFLLLISFEFGMLLTNKNKTLSCAYSLLIAFSPVVQWWFAINGLVEQLIFGQLGVILINWYMKITDYKKRIIIAFGLMISIGGFLLVFYPSWQIPFAYVFILLAIWIFLKNCSNFSYSKKDFLIVIFILSVFSIIMIHILFNSFETIKIIFNTAYPGSEVFNGGGNLNLFTYYIPSIFFPLNDHVSFGVCAGSSFVDLFPISLIITGICLFYQKTKDKLLIGLLVLYIIFIIFYTVQLPDIILNLTLRDHIKTERLIEVISFIGVLLLIRSISNLNSLKNKKLILLISIIMSVIMVYLSTKVISDYFMPWMIVFSVIFYAIVFSSSLLASSRKNQKLFLICIIATSFLTGALVNPIDYGTDVIFESDFTQHVEKIVKNNPDALWITQGMPLDSIIPVGAKTINSVNTYPDLEKWQKLDTNNKSNDIYNRYAHIYIDFQKDKPTEFELVQFDLFKLHLNVNDLEKLNLSYVATNNNLENLSNDNVMFEKIYQDYDFKIYEIKYI